MHQQEIGILTGKIENFKILWIKYIFKKENIYKKMGKREYICVKVKLRAKTLL